MKDIDKKVTATINTGGRITIPKPLRGALGWKPGFKLDMSVGPAGEIIMSEADLSPERRKAVAEAIDRIIERRRQLNLESLTIRCLIDEGRDA